MDGEGGSLVGEAELEEIDAVAKPDQTLAELEGSDLAPRRGNEPSTACMSGSSVRQIVLAITRFSIGDKCSVRTRRGPSLTAP